MRRTLLLVAAALAACSRQGYAPREARTLAEPDPGEVAAVLFLVGDAGAASVDRSPLLHRLRRDVERWSEALATDSAVTVLFLGDNVYPGGVRDPGTRHFARDTAYLSAQAWSVDGPRARAHGTRGIFVAGNHDWGNLAGVPGEERLRNEEQVLASWAEGGRPVSLRPAAGEPGPVSVAAGPATLILLDTQWWLQSNDTPAKEVVVDRLEAALWEARGRPTVLVAHHPLVSAGPHGVRGGVGPIDLLSRAGALVQDLNSRPYTELRDELSRAFRESERPLVYAAGHDHTLQVLQTAGPGRPAWTLVSGAGSKLERVSDIDELEWAASEPGYMRLVLLHDGGVQLFVEAAPASTLACASGRDPGPCMQRALAAYRTVHAQRLR
jgi:hypothetical protein